VGTVSLDSLLVYARPAGWDAAWIDWPRRPTLSYRAWRDITSDSNGRRVSRINIQVRNGGTRNRIVLIRHTPLPGADTVDAVRGRVHEPDNPINDWGPVYCWQGILGYGDAVPGFEIQVET